MKSGKNIINCSIEENSEISKEQKAQLSKNIKEITAINLSKITHISKEIAKEAAKEIIPVLKDFYTSKKILSDNKTYKYLQLYHNLNIKDYLEELRISYSDLDNITQNADKCIKEHFFEMIGVAKNSGTGYFPVEVIGHIASYLKFSDIVFIHPISIDWVFLAEDSSIDKELVLLAEDSSTEEEWTVLG
ncbi:hypothetical protein [Rickettsia endosymbiont of Rhinocyllus conicus]|uniref:hypothetical protein n=1 Tax=Rickettsia endosymbiont of Rhinocyllus conicus TaxID=3066252 RepID=UPI0031330B05